MKENFIFSPQDDPIQKKQKLDTYFYIIFFVLFIIGFWPLAAVLLLAKSKVIKEMEKSIDTFYNQKKTNTEKLDNKEWSRETMKINQESYNEANSKTEAFTSTDRARSIITVIVLTSFILLFIFYYFLEKYGIIDMLKSAM